MHTTAASSARPFRGSALAAPLITAALFVVLYAPVVSHLAAQWLTDPNYQHGLAVPLVSAYILWRRRAALGAAEGPRAAFAGAASMVVAAVLLIGGTAASEIFTARVSLPIMLIGLLLVFKGMQFVRRAAFPLLFLFMMIPLPYIAYYKLTFPLQIMSAKLSALALRFIGIEVIRHGNIIALPTYTLEVVAACSGLRSLMTMITLALVLCAFPGLSGRRKIVLAACSIPIAIAANTIRLVVIAIGAYAVSPAFADGTLHEISGLIVFSTGFLLLLAVWGALKWRR
ncbi:MAG: exosortase/archaeosortase family protein [Candidatus Krumholzibacteria bacterium]|nr:exosortase/archaeosortase family protein [Candidatus Krumholzibacteria bacterium]